MTAAEKLWVNYARAEIEYQLIRPVAGWNYGTASWATVNRLERVRRAAHCAACDTPLGRSHPLNNLLFELPCTRWEQGIKTLYPETRTLFPE